MRTSRVICRMRALGLSFSACVLVLAAGCARDVEPVQPEARAPSPPTHEAAAVAKITTAEDAQCHLQNMQACRARLEAAMQQQIVSNASVDNGRPILWVGPGWKTAPAATQQQVVRDTACFFLSGDDRRSIKFSVYDTASDRELAVWNHTYLVMP